MAQPLGSFPFLFFFSPSSAPPCLYISRCGSPLPPQKRCCRRPRRWFCVSFPPPSPFSLFQVIFHYLFGLERYVFQKPPRKGLRLCPEVTLGDGVEFCSGVSVREPSCVSVRRGNRSRSWVKKEARRDPGVVTPRHCLQSRNWANAVGG